MVTTIKAIETPYKGYRMRSRLEARWGIYFDALGCEWEFEKEGFDLGQAGKYLPDFWLSTVNMWAEVKPETLNATEMGKCEALALATGNPVLLLVGTPSWQAYDVIEVCQGWDWCRYAGIPDAPHEPHPFLTNVLLESQYLHSERRWFWAPGGGEEMCRDAERAIMAARGARFEHGETGQWRPRS